MFRTDHTDRRCLVVVCQHGFFNVRAKQPGSHPRTHAKWAMVVNIQFHQNIPRQPVGTGYLNTPRRLEQV
ncbi:TPA: hypothetical protein ACFM5R_001628, partial [Neisseria meningitidis]